MEKTIQQLFDEYENISIAVEEAEKTVRESTPPVLSEESYITAEQADEHLILCVEYERSQEQLEMLSRQWTDLQEELVDKLCKIKTKVLVKDSRDNSDILIHCEGGSIIMEELDPSNGLPPGES